MESSLATTHHARILRSSALRNNVLSAYTRLAVPNRDRRCSDRISTHERAMQDMHADDYNVLRYRSANGDPGASDQYVSGVARLEWKAPSNTVGISRRAY